MQKQMFRIAALALLLLAAFSAFAVSPAFAATRQAAAPASAHTAQVGTIVCYYKVTATAGLRARQSPSTSATIEYTMNYNTIVAAYKDSIFVGPTITWRQLYDGNWADGEWLQKTSAQCLS